MLILMLFDLLLYYLGYYCQHFSLLKWLRKIAETKETLISSINEKIKTLFAEELAKLKEEASKKMDEIPSTNKMLQQQVTLLKRPNEDLIEKCDENEQCGRR